MSTDTQRTPIPASDVDALLAAQLVVAWAGEGGEEPRLGWWRCDLTSEFGGHDLFRRLLPETWRWAALQGAREAARRRDAELRARAHDPDEILSLFRLGFELDERVEERLQEHKRSGRPPDVALPALAELMASEWNAEAFHEWVQGHGDSAHSPAPIGRLLEGTPPAGLDRLVRRLVGGLSPLSESYPLPHFRERR